MGATGEIVSEKKMQEAASTQISDFKVKGKIFCVESLRRHPGSITESTFCKFSMSTTFRQSKQYFEKNNFETGATKYCFWTSKDKSTFAEKEKYGKFLVNYSTQSLLLKTLYGQRLINWAREGIREGKET